MVEMTRRRRAGQVVVLLGMLAWGFGISYASARKSDPATVLFVVGAVLLVAGVYVIWQEIPESPD